MDAPGRLPLCGAYDRLQCRQFLDRLLQAGPGRGRLLARSTLRLTMTADTGTGSTPKKNSTPEASGQRPIRWWPASVILLLAAGAVLWVRSVYGRNHQEQNIATA